MKQQNSQQILTTSSKWGHKWGLSNYHMINSNCYKAIVLYNADLLVTRPYRNIFYGHFHQLYKGFCSPKHSGHKMFVPEWNESITYRISIIVRGKHFIEWKYLDIKYPLNLILCSVINLHQFGYHPAIRQAVIHYLHLNYTPMATQFTDMYIFHVLTLKLSNFF